jgi:magnesium transporter
MDKRADDETIDIQQLIEAHDWHGLRQTLASLHHAEIAELLLEQEKLNRVLLFRSMPRLVSSEVFAQLDGENQRRLLQELSDEETRQLLTNLAPDDRTQLFAELPGRVTQQLLNLLDSKDLQEARKLLGYPEDSVGRLMTPRYVAVRPSWSIARALAHIRIHGLQSETINVIFVTDHKWLLLDELPLNRFILAEPDQTVEMIMDHTFVSLSAFEDREKAVEVMERYDLTVLPVVDSDGILVGIVTHDDVMDVAQQEATEDIHRISGVEPVDVDYMDAGPRLLWRKRIVWLLLLLLADFMSSGVIAFYEETLATVVTLAFFIPMLIDSGGNTGTQSATLIIRSLSTGRMELGDWPKILWKEFRVGIMLGLTLGAVIYIRSFFWIGGPEIGRVVGLTMVALVIWANIVGALMPMVIARFRLDPAVVSSPFITTLVDVTGLIIYFSIARLLLGI